MSTRKIHVDTESKIGIYEINREEVNSYKNQITIKSHYGGKIILEIEGKEYTFVAEDLQIAIQRCT